MNEPPGEVLTGLGDVSRETMQRLAALVALIERWNPTINLVSPRSLADIWRRHVLDSAQLWRYRPPGARLWYDLGAGGGFPGLVLATLAAEAAPALRFHLIDSDQRKCAFLATAAGTLGVPVTVHARRIADLELPPADVLSARALAPLSALLPHVKTLRRPDGIALFPKGETVHNEIAEAERHWIFAYRLHPSRTDRRSSIVEIGSLDGPQQARDPRPRQPEGRGGKDHHGD